MASQIQVQIPRLNMAPVALNAHAYDLENQGAPAQLTMQQAVLQSAPAQPQPAHPSQMFEQCLGCGLACGMMCCSSIVVILKILAGCLVLFGILAMIILGSICIDKPAGQQCQAIGLEHGGAVACVVVGVILFCCCGGVARQERQTQN